jgi:hypothetical protein
VVACAEADCVGATGLAADWLADCGVSVVAELCDCGVESWLSVGARATISIGTRFANCGSSGSSVSEDT